MIDKKALAEMMGEDVGGSSGILPNYPLVSLHGEKGYFRQLRVDEKTGMYIKPQEKIGQAVSGIVVAVRMQLSEYTKSFRRFTNEYSTPRDHLRLFEVSGGNRVKLMEGTEKEIREKYQGLRSHRWLYMLVGERVVKYRVKGGGFTRYFEYLRDLKKEQKHLFEVETMIEPEQVHNDDLDKDYYIPHFKAVRELPEEVIEIQIAPVIKELKSLFESAAIRDKIIPPPPPGDDIKEELPEINIDEESEVKPEDIPF